MAQTRDRATRKQILEAIQARLVEQVQDLSEDTVLVGDSPNPLTIPPGRVFVIIAPGGFIPDDRAYAGAGHITLMGVSRVRIGLWHQVAIDSAGTLQQVLVSGDDSVIGYYEVKLLRALFNDEWEPQDNDQIFLRSAISLADISEPMTPTDKGGLTYAGEIITLNVEFDYDLRSDP